MSGITSWLSENRWGWSFYFLEWQARHRFLPYRCLTSVSIKVDEIASDIDAYADLQDPDGGRVPDTRGLSVSSIGRPHTPALNGSATVAKAGPHRLEIKFYAREEAGFRESWKKPYRLVVTQP